MALNLGDLDGTNGLRIDGASEEGSAHSGRSVSGTGDFNGDGIDDLIIGAPGANTAAGYNVGVSYVVFGSTTGFAASLDLSALDGSDGFRLDGAADGQESGSSVSDAGDVNGDGIDDLIIGAPGVYSPPGAGTSYVVFGSGAVSAASFELAALDGNTGFRLAGAANYDRVGYSVSSAGDVNGDGLDDLIIGASRLDTAGGENAGASYVVFGRATGFAASLDLGALDGTDGFRLDGVASGDSNGSSVSGAGDVNGDGIDDLIVGAYGVDTALGYSAGAAYVVFGSETGFAASLDLGTLDGTDGFRVEGAAARDEAGRSVSAAGDVNGDGIDDFIIGAPNSDAAGYRSGSSYVVFGTTKGFPANLDLPTLDGSNGFRLGGAAAYNLTGVSVSAAGDFNGDGIDDVIVGSPGFYDERCYIVFGRTSGFEATIDLATLDDSEGLRLDPDVAISGRGFSTSVSAAGDVNGDGIDDVIVGWPYASDDAGVSGASYVVFGFRSGGASTSEVAVTATPDDAEQVGAQVALASQDLDLGDGQKLVGLRFTGIKIPEGATITGAHIEFQARLTGGCPADLAIAVEDMTDAASFGSGGNDIAGRNYLDQTTAWSPEAWVKGESYQTADLAAMLAALVGTDGIDADDALAFRLSGTGERTAWSFDGHGEAPKLVIEYESAGASSAAIEDATVESPVDTDTQADSFDLAGTPAWSDLSLA